MEIRVPQPMRMEHEELLEELRRAARLDGRVGRAAQAVAKALQPHAEKEEAYALPPLGLLPQLAAGNVTPDMARVLQLTDLLKADLRHMLEEHKAIVATLLDLLDIAKAEGQPDCARLAEKLILHTQAEEEISYPTAILIGEYLKLRLRGVK